MSWIQIKLDTTPADAEQLEDLLLSAGACAVTLQDAKDQPLYEPAIGETPLWDATRVIGLFDASADMDAVTHWLKDAFSGPMPRYRVEIVEDRDWEREWMTHFHPMQFGRRLWVCPSWKDVPDPDGVNLMLDPGLAFGTGTHPTTSLCLHWLDSLDIEGKTVVDYGCGSGILAIAALLLGAEKVIAVDNDPQALAATRENARRNKIAPERLQVYLPDQAPEVEADITVANILAGPLIELSPVISGMTKTGGLLGLSGILREQASTVLERYTEWFEMDQPVFDHEWSRLNGVKIS